MPIGESGYEFQNYHWQGSFEKSCQKYRISGGIFVAKILRFFILFVYIDFFKDFLFKITAAKPPVCGLMVSWMDGVFSLYFESMFNLYMSTYMYYSKIVTNIVFGFENFMLSRGVGLRFSKLPQVRVFFKNHARSIEFLYYWNSGFLLRRTKCGKQVGTLCEKCLSNRELYHDQWYMN